MSLNCHWEFNMNLILKACSFRKTRGLIPCPPGQVQKFSPTPGQTEAQSWGLVVVAWLLVFEAWSKTPLRYFLNGTQLSLSIWLHLEASGVCFWLAEEKMEDLSAKPLPVCWQKVFPRQEKKETQLLVTSFGGFWFYNYCWCMSHLEFVAWRDRNMLNDFAKLPRKPTI